MNGLPHLAEQRFLSFLAKFILEKIKFHLTCDASEETGSKEQLDMPNFRNVSYQVFTIMSHAWISTNENTQYNKI